VHYFTHVFLLFFTGVWATNIHDALVRLFPLSNDLLISLSVVIVGRYGANYGFKISYNSSYALSLQFWPGNFDIIKVFKSHISHSYLLNSFLSLPTTISAL
jgi:hypothetical protein